jgi:hypothetical protein
MSWVRWQHNSSIVYILFLSKHIRVASLVAIKGVNLW